MLQRIPYIHFPTTSSLTYFIVHVWLILFFISTNYIQEIDGAGKTKLSRAEKRAVKDANTWFGMQILGFIIICIFIPPIVYFLYELYQDPATPVLRKLLWLRIKELIGYNPYQRYMDNTNNNITNTIGTRKNNKKIDPLDQAIINDILQDILIKREKGLLTIPKTKLPLSSSSMNGEKGTSSSVSTDTPSESGITSLHYQLLDRSEALLRKRTINNTTNKLESEPNININDKNLPLNYNEQYPLRNSNNNKNNNNYVSLSE